MIRCDCVDGMMVKKQHISHNQAFWFIWLIQGPAASSYRAAYAAFLTLKWSDKIENLSKWDKLVLDSMECHSLTTIWTWKVCIWSPVFWINIQYYRSHRITDESFQSCLKIKEKCLYGNALQKSHYSGETNNLMSYYFDNINILKWTLILILIYDIYLLTGGN